MNKPQTLPRIKVCGLTRLEHAMVALHAGAQAFGFVLHAPSLRAVTVSEAQEIAGSLPASMPKVAVLVHATPAHARTTLDSESLNWVQLCGSQQPEDWVSFPFPVLRRIPVDGSGSQQLRDWRGIADGFVLDHPTSPGGSGLAVDWNLAHDLSKQAPCLLAGGLSADNVERAILQARPAGVDASSQLETSPGIKSPALITSFARSAQQAFRGLPS
ncbi:MAG: phosphoribosylanthranilate isomerase [bacterium]|nr:phosphoribosylanthranilate isomerase [bacterium]